MCYTVSCYQSHYDSFFVSGGNILSIKLINSIMVEKNNINLGLSLYLHTDEENKQHFVYYTDYLGYGSVDNQYSPVIEKTIHLDQPSNMPKEIYEERLDKYVNDMNSMSFDDVLSLIACS